MHTGLESKSEYWIQGFNGMETCLILAEDTQHFFLDMAIFCQRRNLDIECDGDTWHGRREAIPRDNERDNLLQANLWHVMRFNTVQLRDGEKEVLGLIREAINQYGGVVEPDQVIRHFDSEGKLGPRQGVLDFGENSGSSDRTTER